MGYLTHLSIYNDGIDLLKTAGEDKSGVTARKVCVDLYSKSLAASCYQRPETIGVDFFCNLINVQIPVHADTPVLYLNSGNQLVDLSVYHPTVKNMSTDYLKKCVQLAKMLVKELDQELKNRKE